MTWPWLSDAIESLGLWGVDSMIVDLRLPAVNQCKVAC